MKTIGFFILVLLSFNVLGRTADDNLTHELAIARKAQVSKVNYSLYFEFKKDSPEFKGKTNISLELKHLKTDLSIDSLLKKIDSIKINGKELSRYPSRRGSFDIPKTLLTKKMELEIAYAGEFSREAHGLKHSRDTIDGEDYIYSVLEPYYAHTLYPSLDQPDIKATFSLTVKSPLQWKVIHNESIQSEKLEKDFKVTTFNPTPLMSTYLFVMALGAFEEFKDKYADIPLSIYARKSMAKYVDEENMFRTMKQGLAYFTKYFDRPYPYRKYGHVFAPDMNVNGLENPGAILIHEQFLFLGPVPSTWVSGRDNIMLHELAHMWFGNLVTMDWWNDLWLKESFATYAATLAQTRELKADFAPLDFLNTKSWGYWQDQMITTHPIESDIPDVRASKGIFDGITYAKGASAMKQLHFYVGEEGFRDGIRAYFKNYANGNASRKDFMDEIAKASGKNLDNWIYKWLQTAGPNKAGVKLECERNVITSFSIIQQKSPSDNLSPHRVRLGLYKLQSNNLKSLRTHDVVYEKEETFVPELNGTTCPDFILPNQDDEDYALYSLDQTSLRHASTALIKLPDALSRYQLWLTLMQMVRNQELNVKTFIEMAREALKFESDEALIGLLFARSTQLRNFRQQYLQYLTAAQRADMAPGMEKVLWQRMLSAKPGSSLQFSFFDFYSVIAQTKQAQERIYDILKKNKAPEGIPMSFQRRWGLIRSLAFNGHPLAKTLIEEEMKNDPSNYGTCMGNAAKSALPDLETKKEIFKLLTSAGTFTGCEYREASYTFNSGNYPELSHKFLDDFFKRVLEINWHSNDDAAHTYFANLFPVVICSEDLLKMSTLKMAEAKNLTSIAKKAWLEANDELSRCVKVRKTK